MAKNDTVTTSNQLMNEENSELERVGIYNNCKGSIASIASIPSCIILVRGLVQNWRFEIIQCFQHFFSRF